MSVFSIASLVQLLADIPTGLLADRFGRRPVITFGSAVSLLFTLCYAFGGSYPALVAGAVLEGLARALFSGTDTALLYESLAEAKVEARYGAVLGRISAAEPVAFAAAALAGGLIAARWSVQLAFWLTLIPQVIALLVSVFLHEPARTGGQQSQQRPSLQRALRLFAGKPRLRLLVAGAAWREALGESSFQLRVVFFQQLWPLWALGIAQTITNVASAVSFYLAGPVITRFGAVRVLIADSILGRIVVVPALLLPSVASPALLSLTSLTYGTGEVATGSLLQSEFSDRERATLGSINSLAINLAFAAGAVALGLLADHIGIVAALVAAQLLLLPGTLLYARLRKDGISNNSVSSPASDAGEEMG
jgi:MFS family permease